MDVKIKRSQSKVMKKTALITGASSGLGKEFAKIHAQNGGNLILVARRENELQQLKKEIEKQYNTKVWIFTKDLTEENAVKEIHNEIRQQNLQVDFLINNAGFGGIGNFHERNLEVDLQMIRLNVLALTGLTGLFLPDFVARNSGKILNVSSIASLMPGPLQATYFATKAFVSSLSNALSKELENTNVTITTLLPGPTATNFGKISGMDKTPSFDKTTSAEEVAQKGYQAMLKGKRNCMAGVPLSLRVLFKIRSLLPMQFILNQVYEQQKIQE